MVRQASPITLETIMQIEQEACNEEEGLFEKLNNNFSPQYNETIRSLQFCKLVRQYDESTEEWMGRLRIAAIEYRYKELDGQLKEKFIHELSDSDVSRNNQRPH